MSDFLNALCKKGYSKTLLPAICLLGHQGADLLEQHGSLCPAQGPNYKSTIRLFKTQKRRKEKEGTFLSALGNWRRAISKCALPSERTAVIGRESGELIWLKLVTGLNKCNSNTIQNTVKLHTLSYPVPSYHYSTTGLRQFGDSAMFSKRASFGMSA